jgi:hypothetical protein
MLFMPTQENNQKLENFLAWDSQKLNLKISTNRRKKNSEETPK